MTITLAPIPRSRDDGVMRKRILRWLRRRRHTNDWLAKYEPPSRLDRKDWWR